MTRIGLGSLTFSQHTDHCAREGGSCEQGLKSQSHHHHAIRNGEWRRVGLGEGLHDFVTVVRDQNFGAVHRLGQFAGRGHWRRKRDAMPGLFARVVERDVVPDEEGKGAVAALQREVVDAAAWSGYRRAHSAPPSVR